MAVKCMMKITTSIQGFTMTLDLLVPVFEPLTDVIEYLQIPYIYSLHR